MAAAACTQAQHARGDARGVPLADNAAPQQLSGDVEENDDMFIIGASAKAQQSTRRAEGGAFIEAKSAMNSGTVGGIVARRSVAGWRKNEISGAAARNQAKRAWQCHRLAA